MNKLFLSLFLIAGIFVTACSDDDKTEADLFSLAVKLDNNGTVKMGKHDCEITVNGEQQYIDVTLIGDFDSFTVAYGTPSWTLISSSEKRLKILVASIADAPQRTGKIEFTAYNGSKSCKGSITITQLATTDPYPDPYITFRVEEIKGTCTNPYIKADNYIRFLRNAEKERIMDIAMPDNLSHKLRSIAKGSFDIERSETNVFTMEMELTPTSGDDTETFSYTLGGDGEYLQLLENYFGYEWGNSIALRSQPVKEIFMILSDPDDDCTVTCRLLPI